MSCRGVDVDAAAEIDVDLDSISLSSHFPDSSLTRAGEGLQSITVGRVFNYEPTSANESLRRFVLISLSSSKVSNFPVVAVELWC
jgi:hypothetical protein